MGNEIAADNKITNITAKKNTREILGWVLHNVVWIWLIALVIIFGAFNEYFLTVFNLQKALLHKDLKCKAPLIEPNLRRNLGKWST
ncbi:hypothetical protein [Acinetobacter guillouiae]|uniref:hypothetical protein n=1 Tax=Acinetobacter guillouiae TaxID=106649 RepID=UPI003CFF5647